nr:MAG TPA: hypothetical protein [Caudoviricetes sp.]
MGNRSTYSTSNYRGGRRGLSTSSGGAVSRGGRYVSRDTVRRDLRVSFGLTSG